ncbi:hypothetical protein [Actinoplanes flavus]|uniref:Uncharacterized protein n=1 Tax=Actinoplanes flavus TaxID=2820290 RepID=A0ABS3UGZ5_9ACTN|nr:hypothetical protein [Actinoplanes flavus]MBO3738036.1 hypothetical protein [Actinoplanes flavus]
MTPESQVRADVFHSWSAQGLIDPPPVGNRGPWPFVHFNRLHVVPPCTITAEELAIFGGALTVAAEFSA